MIGEVCAEIKNWFALDRDRITDKWTIVDNVITPPLAYPVDYIRIKGSRRNDGVHKLSDEDLLDEEFDGQIWLMSPPRDFLSLVTEIDAWQKKYGGISSSAMSPFNSESFGGYSYSKAAGSISGAGTSTTWQSLYGDRLKKYRRVMDI